MSHAIDAILDSYHASALQEMAQAAGLVSKSGARTRKTDLIALMRSQYFTKERVAASLSKLSPYSAPPSAPLSAARGPSPRTIP